MKRCSPRASPRRRRSTEMLWFRLFSSTAVSGQTARISSSLSSTVPACSTRYESVSRALPARGTLEPSPRQRRRFSRSRRKSPNSYTRVGRSATAASYVLRNVQGFLRTSRPRCDDAGHMSEGARAMTIPRGWFYGWVVVAASAVGLFLGAFPIVAFSFGVFFQSFTREFHAGRAAVSLAFTIHNLLSGVSAVVIGRIADRIGARRIILSGLAVVAMVLLSAEAIGSRLSDLYLFYIVLGIVGSATTTVPYALVVSRWFDRRRGLALGGMMIGLGVGASAMPLVAQRLIASFGWRHAFAMVGCAMVMVPMPIVGIFLREAPADMGLLPDGASTAGAGSGTDHRPEGVTWRHAAQSRTFWLLIAVFMLLAA